MNIGNDEFWKKVIYEFGYKNQLNKLKEELFELGTSVCHRFDGKSTEREMISEMVDVAIIIHQFSIYNPELTEMFDQELASKTQRMRDRLTAIHQSQT